MLDGDHYEFQVIITRGRLVPGFAPTAKGCVPAAETEGADDRGPPDAEPGPALQFQTVSGLPSGLATFGRPGGRRRHMVFSSDGQSVAVPRDEVKIALRAIRLRPLAAIPPSLVFNPQAVAVTVASTSTNVFNGVVQADGTQPTVTPTTTTLELGTPALSTYGDPVTLTATVFPAPANAEEAVVEFFNGETLLGTGTIDDGEANLTVYELPLAVRAFSARFTGTPALSASRSAVLTQHVVRRFSDREAFDAAILGGSLIEDFNAPPTGTAISELNPINGALDFTSSFDILQIFGGVPPPPPAEGLIGTVAFGNNDGSRRNGRYDLIFTDTTNALAFDIVAQDPAASPAQIEVLTSAGAAYFSAVNGGTESNDVFHGFVATVPLVGVRVYEGCEVNEPVEANCLNEEIAIDNVTTAGRDVRHWSADAGGNNHYYEYVKVGGLSWDQANAAAQARTYLGMTGRLVSITSAEENAFVESLRGAGSLRAWLGLRDTDGTGPASWTWTSGEGTTYFNWSAGEPNNLTTEFWVEMFTGGAWNNNTMLDPIYPTEGYIVEYIPIF